MSVWPQVAAAKVLAAKTKSKLEAAKNVDKMMSYEQVNIVPDDSSVCRQYVSTYWHLYPPGLPRLNLCPRP
jgi:hypothetical protein